MAATETINNPQALPAASWTLAPATVDDMGALVAVHTAAFRSDLFSHLMLLGRPDGAHQTLMRKSLEHWFDNPRASLTKAVDADGHIVAWACWVLRDDDPPQAQKPMAASPPETAAAPKETTTTPAPAATSKAHPNEDPTRALGGRMREDMLQREAAHMPRGTAGGGCLVLQALATEPALQGRGIATQLVRAGTERADAEGLPCWAHASPAGHALYSRNEFREVVRDDYDLAKWAPGGEGAGRGWGMYTFRYMLRPVGGHQV